MGSLRTPDLVLDLPNDLGSIGEAVEFVMARCPVCGDAARRLRLKLRVGLTEALSNAMLYGNGPDPSKKVRVEVVFEDAQITARVTDQGRGFNPTAVPDPTTPKNIMKPRGRGIFLMRKLLDEVHYNDRGNSVTLVLRLGGSADGGGGVGGGALA